MGDSKASTSSGVPAVSENIGTNDPDNVADSSAVVANPDGSIYERLEYIQASLSISGGPANLVLQPDVPISQVVGVSEATLIDLSAGSTRYALQSLRLKSTNPSSNKITIRLYKLINDVEAIVDEFEIDSINYDHENSLADMFGLSQIFGDLIKVKAIADGGTHTITGQYSHAKAI